MAEVEIVPHDMAHKGEAVGKVDGKVHFVAGAIPGERVRARVLRKRRSWARAVTVEVLDASAARIEPPCPHFEACGGCQWQFADHPTQLVWKRDVVAGQLRHLGGIEDPPVADTIAPGPPFGYRNRMDYSVADGRPALHPQRSWRATPLDTCLILHPTLHDLFDGLGDLTGVDVVTLRSGTRTGERIVLIAGEVPGHAAEWGVPVARRHGPVFQPVIGDPTFHEEVAGVRFRVTMDAFFQNNTDGAEALVRVVSEHLDAGPGDVLLDAYAGGGLFAATVGRSAGRVVAVESNPPSVADLRVNLTKAGIGDHRVVDGPVEEVVPDLDEEWDVVVADPPRSGLGEAGIRAVTARRPRRIAYVSCDPAALGRDAGLFTAAGYVPTLVQPVDLFPQTYHIETVAIFDDRDGG